MALLPGILLLAQALIVVCVWSENNFSLNTHSNSYWTIFQSIAGDWKATALRAEVWVETVTEGGRRFMAAWRKEEVDAARHRREKREATRLGNLLSQTGV